MSRRYKITKDIPLFKKDSVFIFFEDSESVFRVYDDGTFAEYPLREELAGYLWLIKDDFLQEV